MEDFFKQKVCWTPVNSEYRFTLVPKGTFFNNSLFMITGEGIEIICAVCNSKLYQYFLSKILSGDNYQYGSGKFFESLPIIKRIDEEKKVTLIKLVNEIQKDYTDSKLKEIDLIISDLYNLSNDERKEIGVIETL